MDLRIKNNNATKSYVITNNCTTRPRVCMKSDTGVPATPISYLPLTTSTTQGLALRAKVNDQSYRALEFRSMSGSATFYSSNANGQGLSSTTALTRASTSRTEYLTQSSTSRTEYLTRSSTSATSYLTRSSTSGESYLTALGTNITFSITNYNTGWYSWQGSYSMTASGITVGTFMSQYGTKTKSTIQFGTSSSSGYAYDAYGNQRLQYYYWITYYARYDMDYAFMSRSFSGSTNKYYTEYSYSTSSQTANSRLYSVSSYPGYAQGHYFASSTSIGDVVNMSYSSSATYTNGDYGARTQAYDTYTRGYEKLTTGTSYLTRSSTSSTIYYTRSSTYDTVYYTRSSTYSTVYHTRSSTSGYSGISSSSSETSGWQ